MNEANRRKKTKIEGLVELPAYPHTGHELLADLKRRVGEELGVKLTTRRLSKIWGVPSSNIFHWMELYHQRQIMGFMLLLERLSREEQQRFLEKHCRPFPNLGHPRLALTAAGIAGLFRILDKPTGLTVIHGGTESGRAFLSTAMAHSWSAKDANQRTAIGIAVHRPADFVPVETVNYIDPVIGIRNAQRTISRVWPKILTSNNSLVVLNRVWSMAPYLRREILRLSKNKHVLLADLELPLPQDLQPILSTYHLLTVSHPNHDFAKIVVHFRLKKR